MTEPIVFVSHATADREVAEGAVRRLESEGIACWIAPRDIRPSHDFPSAIVEAIRRARLMLLVLSRSAVGSPHVKREVFCAEEHRVPVLPFRVEDVELDEAMKYMLGPTHWLDARDQGWAAHLPELARAVARLVVGGNGNGNGNGNGSSEGEPRHRPQSQSQSQSQSPPIALTPIVGVEGTRLALLYKRKAEPDASLVDSLEKLFADRGFRVFVDRHMKIGIDWSREIDAQLRQTDAVIPLISAASVNSEMLAHEVQTAHEESQVRGGLPRILPVRVGYEGPLPADLARILDPIQYSLWRGPGDTPRLADELIEALQNPRPSTPTGPAPVGGLPLDAPTYIARAVDAPFLAAVARRDATILVRGPRQVGKTSLVARGLRRARDEGSSVAFSDFQRLSESDLRTPETLFRALGASIAEDLGLDELPDDSWDPRRSANANFEAFLKRKVFPRIDRPLVWALDEVDRLFSCPFGSEVFALFRSWHNARAVNPDGPWGRLTTVIAYATEAHLFITDLNQSPFNVGIRFALEDFTTAELAELDRRHGAPLGSAPARAAFGRLVGGHPYLANRGLYELVASGLSLEQFAATAGRDEGLFGDHLRRILVMLGKDSELLAATTELLRVGARPSPRCFYRLRAAGLIVGDSPADARPRCALYDTYLKRHLIPSA
jgi:hypothetical protein